MGNLLNRLKHIHRKRRQKIRQLSAITGFEIESGKTYVVLLPKATTYDLARAVEQRLRNLGTRAVILCMDELPDFYEVVE